MAWSPLPNSPPFPPLRSPRQVTDPAAQVGNQHVEQHHVQQQHMEQQPSGDCLSYTDSCAPESMLDVHSFLSENWDRPCHSIHEPIVPGGVQPAAVSRDTLLNQAQPLPFTPLRSNSLPCLDGPQATSGPVTHPAADEAKPVDNPLASATPQCSSAPMPYRIFSFQN